MGTDQTTFDEFFRSANGQSSGPFPFQSRFAEAAELPPLVDVPTGLGKTAMAVLGWLWRRRFGGDPIQKRTPRRLVYCLPMRVLVEQTRENTVRWLKTLGLLGGDAEFDGMGRLIRYEADFAAAGKITVHVLMGGEDAADWELYPERDMILIGTQDMLLSRALNRGYAASRARWPMQFGLLHTDCLWVFDEIQLMGSGLATTAQLEAFRRLLPNPESDEAKYAHRCRSVWMSATLKPLWLETVDYKDRLASLADQLTLSAQDEQHPEVVKRRDAKKPLEKTDAHMGDAEALAAEVVTAHGKHRGLTLVVTNTVRGACELFDQIEKRANGDGTPQRVLLHSRFRPLDRQRKIDALLSDPPPEGTICVSTQVVEAGVDVDATTLFTELAPWASLVQRFGRCNRRGERNDAARVFWIGLPETTAAAEKAALPYELPQLQQSAEHLEGLRDVGIKSLPQIDLPFQHTHVIRKRDLIDLFDTTPDLAGNDIDIDRYVRDVDEGTDVRVFWRTWDGAIDGARPPRDKKWRYVSRDELCPVPVGSDRSPGFRQFAAKRSKSVWRWNQLDGVWEHPDSIVPGQVYLVRGDFQKNGTITTPGYDPQHGWGNGHNAEANGLGPIESEPRGDDEYDDDGLSMTDEFESIAQHTNKVCDKLAVILAALKPAEADVLRVAGRWHDFGKAHEKFQIKIDDGQELADKEDGGKPQFRRKRDGEWSAWTGRRDVAKAPRRRWNQQGELVDPGFWPRGGKAVDGFRKHFRHELASALAVLQRPDDPTHSLRDLQDLRTSSGAVNGLDLVAYLIAAHHGKVRLSIRSMPNEGPPDPRTDSNGRERRFARGVWDGDTLPEVCIGTDSDGRRIMAPAVTLSLEPMEIGLCEKEPFRDQPSWLERALRLRDTLGPFRLAYLEALLRAADWRASAAAVSAGGSSPPEEAAHV